MAEGLFIIALALFCGIQMNWGFRNLPRERWQILAAVPHAGRGDGTWSGINFTWYGLFNANAYVLGAFVAVMLQASIGIPVELIVAPVVALLLICIPASRIVARIVEKKSHTFTVGGASFVGIVLAPWMILLTNVTVGKFVGGAAPVLPVLAALSIGYCFGEGMGRLGCVSFGCCYGKRLSDCSPVLRKWFDGRSFVFFGKTKKIVYASKLEGEKILPVQAVTSCIYVLTGVAGTVLFFTGWSYLAFALTVTVSQCWRVFSEFFREDYRGGGKISAYQAMSAVAVVYALCLPLFFTSGISVSPDIAGAVSRFWTPWSILGFQCLWAAVFVYTGRSTVTGATLSFHVHADKI